MNDLFEVLAKYSTSQITLENAYAEIESRRYNFKLIKDGMTPFVTACFKKLKPIALKLIETGQSAPEYVDKDGNSTLMIACKYDSEVALKLIETRIPIFGLFLSKIRPEQVNNRGETALMIACWKSDEEVALKLIETGRSLPQQIDDQRNTALIYACSSRRMENVALKLLKTRKSRPEQVNNEGSTALIEACKRGLENVALKLLETGKSSPEQVNDERSTALIEACKRGLENAALKIIATGKSRPEQKNADNKTAIWYAHENELHQVENELNNLRIEQKILRNLVEQYSNKEITLEQFDEKITSGDYDFSEKTRFDGEHITTLMWVIIHAKEFNLTPVALLLIKRGQLGLSYISKSTNSTALMLACKYGLSEIALELLEQGMHSKVIEQRYIKDGFTALMYACKNGMSEVALKLIETEHSVPSATSYKHKTALMLACESGMSEVALKIIKTNESLPSMVEDENENTALIYACQKSLSDVAITLIGTGDSNPSHVNKEGKTALIYASENNLTDVINESSEGDININMTGFDQVNQETKKIKDHLRESPDNICFKINNQFILTSKRHVKRQLTNTSNIKYGCKRAGEQLSFTMDENILYDTEYFSFSAISSFQILVEVKIIENILNNVRSSNLYYLKRTDKKFPSIISKQYVDESSGLGADHCQTGKETYVYKIIKGLPIEGEEQVEEPTVESIVETKEINILYKGVKMPFPVSETSTLEEIKNALLNKLVADGKIPSINQNVKFIYQGKIYNDMSVMLSNLTNPPFGITLQAMVSPIPSGGSKTRRNKNIRKKSVRGRKCCRRKTKKNRN